MKREHLQVLQGLISALGAELSCIENQRTENFIPDLPWAGSRAVSPPQAEDAPGVCWVQVGRGRKSLWEMARRGALLSGTFC